MSDLDFILRLVMLATLVAYLIHKQLERERKSDVTQDPPKWTVKPIGDSNLAPSVERVRRDYLAARQRPLHLNYYRRALIAIAREAVEKLGYFKANGHK